MKSKVCSRCKKLKRLGSFTNNKRTKDGLSCYCKACSKIMRRIQWSKDKERSRSIARGKARIYGLTPIGRLIRLRAQVRRRGKADFLIGKEEFIKWFKSQDFLCHYCGQSLSVNGERQMNTMTFDRKNNDGPYSMENIALACWRCNAVKGRWFNEEEMLEIGEKYLWGKVEI